MKVWWCEEHLTDSVKPSTDAVGKWLGIVPDECWYWRFLRSEGVNEKPCRFVEMRLVPGGEFLPEGALVIEKEEAAKYRRWWCTSPLQPKCAPGGVHPFEDPDMHESCAWVFVVPSAQASQVGESG